MAAAPASADTSTQWPLHYLKAPQVWNITKGSGTTIAVLDTGVASIPDTRNDLLSGAGFVSGGGSSTGDGQEDLAGHGTGMAVMIAGSGSPYEGLAPDTKILPVQVITGSGLGQADNVAAGIEYAISQHVQVISMSLYVSPTDPALTKAVRDADDAGIVVVAASGNQSSRTVDFPAQYAGVVAVSAVDQSGLIANFSNTGPRVTVAAPGVNVPTEDETGSTGTADGTSASTAYVSATVALIRSDHPSWTAGQVIRDLIATADPGPGQNAGQHSDQYGYGIVDPLAALRASAPTQTTNPLLGASTGGRSTASARPGGATPTGNSATAPSSSSRTGLVVGIVVAVVVVTLIIVLLIVPNRKNRKNRNNRGGGPGGPGGASSGRPQPPQQGGGDPYHRRQQQQR